MLRRATQGRWRELSRAQRRVTAVVGVLVVATAAAVAYVLVLGTGSDGQEVDTSRIAAVAVGDRAPDERMPAAENPAAAPSDDPFAYERDRRDEFAERATSAYSHVLYAKSPGGIAASARRTRRWRPLIERAAGAHGVDPDLMEAVVLLESAGRPEVIAGDDPAAASGLAQIVASTGIDLLRMGIDLPRSQQLTKDLAQTDKRIEKARDDAASNKPKVRSPALLRLRRLARERLALARERRRVDERFQPAAALDGMGTYLELAVERFGDPELATVSYHMGIGNLESVIGRYLDADAADGAAAGLVDDSGLTYAQIFFDSSPLEHRRAFSLLSSFGDDSSTYLWRVLAAERIMRLFRDDPDELRRLAELQTAKATQEEVFHPQSKTDRFADPQAIADARDADELVPIPAGGDLGYRIDDRLGELAPKLGVEPSLYRALRPEALAALVYMVAKVREINDGKGELTMTSGVRDVLYQGELTGINPEATRAYSLHTTGYSFDILRKYSSNSQARAFQFVLARLRALDVIDYAVEPAAIHVTVSDEANALLAQ